MHQFLHGSGSCTALDPNVGAAFRRAIQDVVDGCSVSVLAQGSRLMLQEKVIKERQHDFPLW